MTWNRSTSSLLVSNAITIAVAVFQKWSIGDVLFVYWWQSVIIGIFNLVRMLSLKKFSTENFKSNGKQVEANRKGQVSTARFFAIHYGMFHLGYLLFLVLIFQESGKMHFSEMALLVLIFAVNHFVSVRETIKIDAHRVPNIGTVMLFPYARIVPMHLILILAGMIKDHSILMLAVFLGMKTCADLVMHLVEHRSDKQIIVEAGKI